MPPYAAPARDIDFLLHEVMQITESDIPGYNALERDVTGAIATEAGRLAAEVLEPLNAVGDREGCRLTADGVTTPTGFRAAFDQLRDAHWTTLDCAEADGGQGMGNLIGTMAGEIWVAGNMALNMYHGLTHGAYSTIAAHGTAAQQALYLPRLASCTWTGTMNLTEPAAGTDLGLLKTRADPQPDGSYSITGTKIFISAGDHDLAENIIHLVLARLPDAPAGVKGISLFIVPKIVPNPDGSLGARNRVEAVALEDKMGIHGNATCEMRYDGATGELLGAANKGLAAMFTMMNEARLSVGIQGLGIATIAHQKAVAYASDRLQGRAVTGAVNPEGPADPIIAHPDVRRMLARQRAFIEGARALAYWVASLNDRARLLGDAQAAALAGLLVPVVKGVLTERGFDTCVEAQQVWGGHGYIEGNGMSQYARDARIAMIYEGANGVQALDLVGRKLPQQGGAAIRGLLTEIRAFIAEHGAEKGAEDGADAQLAAGFLAPLATALDDLEAATGYLAAHGFTQPEAALAGATDYMQLLGHVVLGYQWAQMARAAEVGLAGGTDTAFYRAKLATGRYYMARELPATGLHRARIETGADPVMAIDPESF